MSPIPSEPWRRVCPDGHRSWASRSDGYYCQLCKERFDTLHDAAETGPRPAPPAPNRGSDVGPERLEYGSPHYSTKEPTEAD